MPEPTELTALKLEAFLKNFARTGNVSKACKASKLSRQAYYDHKKADPDFAQRVKEAEEAFVESMEAEADRRAMKGTLKPVFHLGKEVGHIRQYSDTLLIFRLKALRPDKYRERAEVEHKGEGVISIQINAPANVADARDPGADDDE